MSKNIFKYHQVVVKDETKLMIDNNDIVAKKLERLEEQLRLSAIQTVQPEDAEGFVGGLIAEHVELEEGMDAQLLTADESLDREVFEKQAQDIISEAKSEAEEIKIRAQAEAEVLKEEAREEAKEEGYHAGYEEGMSQLDEQKRELEEEKRKIEIEYHEMVEKLEPKFIETLTDIYGHVFRTDLSKEKGIIAHLISSTMQKIEGNSSYLIHVSKEDYSYVLTRKEEILSGAVSLHSSVDIVEDITLGAGDCIIETEGGVFDCGLGTQLEELAQKLKLLSFTRGQ